jgi:hypothetical protein
MMIKGNLNTYNLFCQLTNHLSGQKGEEYGAYFDTSVIKLFFKHGASFCRLVPPLVGFNGGLCMPISMIRRSKLLYKEERLPHQQLV